MRVVAYLRRDHHGQSLEEQRRVLGKWARSSGHRLVAECIDDFCRTGKLAGGPGLIEALGMILDHEADGVGVSSLSRLGADPRSSDQVNDRIRRAGGQVWSATSGEEGFGLSRPECLPQRRRVVLEPWHPPRQAWVVPVERRQSSRGQPARLKRLKV